MQVNDRFHMARRWYWGHKRIFLYWIFHIIFFVSLIFMHDIQFYICLELWLFETMKSIILYFTKFDRHFDLVVPLSSLQSNDSKHNFNLAYYLVMFSNYSITLLYGRFILTGIQTCLICYHLISIYIPSTFLKFNAISLCPLRCQYGPLGHGAFPFTSNIKWQHINNSTNLMAIKKLEKITGYLNTFISIY